MTRSRAARRLRPTTAALAALVLPLALGLGACSGSDEPSLTPKQALGQAGRALDDTSGIELDLSTPELPASVSGLLSATGVGTSAPAFDGEIRVSVAGVGATVPVISVDGTTYATLPFTTEYVEVDPADFGAPDPADLFGSGNGLSSLVTGVERPTAGEPVREGSVVLTRYSGTLPGAAVQSVVPVAPADADFDATFTLDDQQRLTKAVLTGPFYGAGTDEVTYTVSVDAYDITPDITAP